MPSFKRLRQARFDVLRADRFTPLEARLLSALPKNTPAVRLMRADRVARWERFVVIARRKVDRGQWKRGEVTNKWATNLARFYTKKRWRVQFGPEGGQPSLPKGSPNPFAMYRYYEKQAPRKKHVSPWEIRQIRGGKTLLQKGLIFVQKTEQQARHGGISKEMLRDWIEQKEQAIKTARGKKRVQLMIERNRLQRLL